MNRLLVAVAVALSLSAFGCAAGTEDPEPTPTPEEPQRDPPKQTLGGELEDPFAVVEGSVRDGNQSLEVGPRQKPPIPELSEL
jgi:hypothetical protein